MPPTAAQRQFLSQFSGITGSTEKVAIQYLKRCSWQLDEAVDLYFRNNPGANNASVDNPVTKANLTKLFEKYRDPKNDEKDVISMSGIMAYFTDLDVNLEDASCLIALETVQTSAIGELKKDEFLAGWKAVGNIDTIEKQKNYIATQAQQLSSNSEGFKKVYRHAFVANKERGQRALSLETAIASWQVLFAPPGPTWASPGINWLELWLEFLQAKWSKSVNKDMWNETLRFSQASMKDPSMSFWSEDSAWPGVIDDFVAFVKEKQSGPEAADKMETEE